MVRKKDLIESKLKVEMTKLSHLRIVIDMIFILNPNPTSLSFKESWLFNIV